MFHKHKPVTKTLFASELPMLRFTRAINNQTKKKFYIRYPGWEKEIRCPDHQEHELDYSGKCRRYCHYAVGLCDAPNTANVIITVTTCLTCNHYAIKAQDSEYTYEMNTEYAKILIDKSIKDKEDKEMERLLNYGNPEFADKKKNEERHVKIITQLQEHLRGALHNLNKSLSNDGLWECLPEKEKIKLNAKYGHAAKKYSIDVDKTVEKIMRECEAS
jgi:hypothetical protein